MAFQLSTDVIVQDFNNSWSLFHTNTDLQHSYGVGAVYSKLQNMAVYGTYF